MISILLLIILAWSFYIGYNRGLILQVYYTFSSVLALIIATAHYKSLAKLYYLWVPFATATKDSRNFFFANKYLFSLDKIFYAGLAFLTIYIIAYTIMRFIGIFVHFLNFADPDTQTSKIVSGVLGVVVAIISLQLLLTVVATIPLATVQNLLHRSWVANSIIQYTPILSSVIKQLWMNNIAG